LGNQLTTDKVKTINTLESLPYEEPQEEELIEEDLGDEEIVPTPENDNNGTQTELEF
jgi:DNA gyrase/topoisomerase IV, A subunit domain protein